MRIVVHVPARVSRELGVSEILIDLAQSPTPLSLKDLYAAIQLKYPAFGDLIPRNERGRLVGYQFFVQGRGISDVETPLPDQAENAVYVQRVIAGG